MNERIFVDTNVLVYWQDSGQAAKRAVADQWIRQVWREQSGRTSMQVLNELYVTLTRKLKVRLKADEAWDSVNALFAWDPQPTSRDLLVRAHEIEGRYAASWWDSLIVAAAQLQHCSMLLTEDLQHGMDFGGVTVRNPFESSVQEVRPRYQVEAIPSRHRPRGRPRKRTAAI